MHILLQEKKLVQTFEDIKHQYIPIEEQFPDPQNGWYQEFYMTKKSEPKQVMHEGKIENGKRDGLWLTKDREDNIIGTATYKAGVLVDNDGKEIKGHINEGPISQDANEKVSYDL